MKTRVRTKRAANNKQLKELHTAAREFDGFQPAADVFRRVIAVPTIFAQFDHGVRVGGLPTERISLVHGPSGQGKTLFTLGLVRSFLQIAFPADFIDAERTLEKGFIDLAIGEDLAKKCAADGRALFTGCKPDTYENTRTRVRKYCNIVAERRVKKKFPSDAAGLVIVDSIRKLVPKDQWDKLLELNKAAGKDEKARDRAQQHKAAMNAAWCDELIPLLEQTGCSMVIIARESDDPNADARTKMYGGGYITGGGSALYYDASLDIRVDRARYVQKENQAEKEGGYARPTIYGERHRITIKKSKVSGKEDKTIVCHFHSSNGKLIPPGFDRARDIVELGVREGIIKGGTKPGKTAKKAGGGWMQWQGQKWQGEHAAVKKLTATPELLAELEREVRAKFQTINPIEISPDGEVIED